MSKFARSRVPARRRGAVPRAAALACVLAASLQTGARARTPPAAAPGEAAAIESAERGGWRAGRDVEPLPDRSVLTLYYGETAARGGVPARLRVGFVPRFECAPVIALVLDEALATTLLPAGAAPSAIDAIADPSASLPDAPVDAGESTDGDHGSSVSGPDPRVGPGLRDDDEAAFVIDGDPVGFPVIVDAAGGLVEIAYNGNERERTTLKLQLDTGDIATVGVRGAAGPIVFSLLGSRRTLARAESSCLVHEPVPLPE